MIDRANHFPVIVKEHAKIRCRERFPELKTARIVDEVRDGIRHGRISARKPESLVGGDFPGGLYVWTPDQDRVYGVAAHDDGWIVRTVLYRQV